jgi:hypothetical protein
MWQEAAMIHRNTKNTRDLRSTAPVLGAFAVLALAAGGLTGCASATDAAALPQTPATQAATIVRTECGAGYRDDAQVAEIVSGSLVEGVAPIYTGIESSRSHQHFEGAAIRVRPLKGASAEWLARALTCHGAEGTLAQSKGQTVPSDPFSLPDGVPSIQVRSAGDAFVVEVKGNTPAEAGEILARAKALGAAAGFARANTRTDREMAVDLSR